MEIEKFDIPDLVLLKPKIFNDERGYFFESFNERNFKTSTGLDIHFCQDNESKSSFGTLRGLHLQTGQYAQSKLIRVISGKILDVVVDCRTLSHSFGTWMSFELSESNKHQLFVPKGFAHGFVVLSETAIVSYKVDQYYSANHESGIIYNDQDLKIDWQLDLNKIILSTKDQHLPSFIDYCKINTF